MAGTLRSRSRRNLNAADNPADSFSDTTFGADSPSSDLEIYAKEVLNALIMDNLPPTPSNFSLYFDRLLEEKSETLRKQIISMLELEESNDAESTILLEQSLKKGFSSIKNILVVTANLYKNMSLMVKILDKRKSELAELTSTDTISTLVGSLDGDISKLNTILKKQNSQMKNIYDETAEIVKNVENETIFDNQYGVYNKRYLMTKILQEVKQVAEFKHKSSLIMIELSRTLKESVKNEKAIMLMTRTIARLLLKTSRRSDTVAHYGNGVFAMLLKHTDITNAKKTAERLSDLVSNSNFFLGDREIKIQISIGVTDIDSSGHTVEEILVSSMDGIEKAYLNPDLDFAVSLRDEAN